MAPLAELGATGGSADGDYTFGGAPSVGPGNYISGDDYKGLLSAPEDNGTVLVDGKHRVIATSDGYGVPIAGYLSLGEETSVILYC